MKLKHFLLPKCLFGNFEYSEDVKIGKEILSNIKCTAFPV